MAYGIVLEFNGVDESQYDAVNEKLGINPNSGAGDWPEGILSHAAGKTNEGWVVAETWESKSAQEAFLHGRLRKALSAAGVALLPRVTEYAVVADRRI